MALSLHFFADSMDTLLVDVDGGHQKLNHVAAITIGVLFGDLFVFWKLGELDF